MSFVILHSAICRGDILIEKNPFDRAIIEHTGCEYTHAILCDNFPTAYEAGTNGVTELSLIYKLYESPDDAILLRPKPYHDQSRLEDYVVYYAKERFGTGYGFNEAYRMMGERPAEAETPNRQLCTRLVAKAYQHVGIKLVDNVDYPLIREFLDSDKLERVDDFLREATPEDIEVTKDGSSRLVGFPKFLTSILTEARKIYEGHDIQSIQQLVALVYGFAQKKEYLEKDSQIESFMQIGRAHV